MSQRHIKTFPASVLLLCCLFIVGCNKAREIESQRPAIINLKQTIASLSEVVLPGAVKVEGLGVVDNLRGTGSAECPPQIRSYLQQYILKQSSDLDPDRFLNSSDTAVVFIEGVIPDGAYQNQFFDLRVSSLAGTQTTSLEGGWLYRADLKLAGRFSSSIKVLARAEGSVFIDTLGDEVSDKTSGYILAGGKVLEEFDIHILPQEPDYKTSALIRDRLNERFGKDTANAVSPEHVVVKVPQRYRRQKRKFESVIKSTYVMQTREAIQVRIIQLVGKLASSANKQESESALEAIGRQSLGKLEPLLGSSDEETRLSAARCMLNIGSDKGLEALLQIVRNKDSLYRIEALEAISMSANRNMAAAISRQLLRGDDFNIRLAAYESLLKLDDIAIMSDRIGRKFYLDQISQTAYKGIYVTRSGRPSIVLFGAPLYCRDNVFIQSSDGNITINAQAPQPYVSIMHKHPTQPNIGPIQLKSSFAVSDIIRTLCEEPIKKSESGQPGLNVSYAEVIALLKQMCQKGTIEAEFREGPLPKIGS